MPADDKEQLAALGRVLLRSAVLEDHALVIAGWLAGMDSEISEIVLAPMAFQQRLGIITKLIEHKSGKPVSPKLKEAIKAAKLAAEDRNEIVHSSWLERNREHGSIDKENVARNLKKGQEVNVTAERLNQLAEKIRFATENFMNAYIAFLVDSGVIKRLET